MPELPEVEIVKQGLAPALQNARIDTVILNRANLRFPFPHDFIARLSGQKILQIQRRAKYLLFKLDSGDIWLSHLGMTGNFRLLETNQEGEGGKAKVGKHDHAVFELSSAQQEKLSLVYSDPRRFGFMDVLTDPDASPFLAKLGPEPLGNQFNGAHLAARFEKRTAPVKSLLLDQSVVAGLGNIYVCEALFHARINPKTSGVELSAQSLLQSKSHTVSILDTLARQIRRVLEDAITAGGSTLRDYRNVDGQKGYFQHNFAVYGRQGLSCQREKCRGTITRVVQSGRSSFYCPSCQHA